VSAANIQAHLNNMVGRGFRPTGIYAAVGKVATTPTNLFAGERACAAPT
jgi:hypothetical protein